MRSFATEFHQNPGRFNLLKVAGRQVVIDYFHNPHALEAMAEFVSRMEAPHTIAIIQMAGDRRDEDIAAFGRLAGRTFDEPVIREPLPKFRRARQPGEVPALLQTAAIAEGLAPDKITLMPDHVEYEAARVAIAEGAKVSLVVVFADDAAAIWNHLTQRNHGEVTG